LRIARYQYKGKEYYGILQSDSLLCLVTLAKRLNAGLPTTMDSFIADQTAQETAEELLLKAKKSDLDAVSVPLNQAKLLPPIQSPPKILCLGLNFASHISETKEKRPEEPVIFIKPHTTIVGPNDKIIKRTFVTKLDYEGELAIVVGKKAKDVSLQEAPNHVFGYTILNDVSARDFQFKNSQWTIGKSFDTFAPIGPCITTKNELPNPGRLSIKTWVNNELRQNGNTRDMIFNVSQIIQFLSRVMTLEPGDIIATGTPSGVAMSMETPKWLQNGDMVRIEIEKIGVLENTVEEI
jgi:2-keto-4-pentenoate hydratase/2-oxohepta-3-ene-1,7-dioic acid hydratase in catechol pathway